jgi:hypothetical protein
MITNRAWVLLPSGRRLDLLNPDPEAWTDHDLSVGLSRTYRWAGYSAWDLPLSVAQHSLTVLAIRQASHGLHLTPPEAPRELLHDAEEALLGGWDPITPFKPHLGPGFDALVRRLQSAVAERYRLPAWTPASYALHKHADRLAAASEAFHVAGWSQEAMRESLGITLEPLVDDPLPASEGMRPWNHGRPIWRRISFLTRMNELQTPSSQGRAAERCRHARPR